MRASLDASEREELRRTHGGPLRDGPTATRAQQRRDARSIYLQPAQRVPLELFLREEGGEFASPEALLSVVVSLSGRVQDVPQ